MFIPCFNYSTKKMFSAWRVQRVDHPRPTFRKTSQFVSDLVRECWIILNWMELEVHYQQPECRCQMWFLECLSWRVVHTWKFLVWEIFQVKLVPFALHCGKWPHYFAKTNNFFLWHISIPLISAPIKFRSNWTTLYFVVHQYCMSQSTVGNFQS